MLLYCNIIVLSYFPLKLWENKKNILNVVYAHSRHAICLHTIIFETKNLVNKLRNFQRKWIYNRILYKCSLSKEQQHSCSNPLDTCFVKTN